MFKNFSPPALNISGRQSEIIELALTYGFRGFNVDMSHMARQAQKHDLKHATRFIDSAKILVGEFDLPVRLDADDDVFRGDLVKLAPVLEVAQAVGATRSVATVAAASDTLPYHENFERHRKRLDEVANVLAGHNIKLGLYFQAAAHHRADKQLQFIHEAEALLLLVKTTGNPNVGVGLDTWNWRLGGGGIDQIKELSADQVVAVRVADFADDADWEKLTAADRVLPGTGGAVNNVEILKTLAEAGYEGPVTPWPSGKQFTGDTRDNIVRTVSDNLDEILVAAGVARPKTMVAEAAAAAVADDK